jgi:hypothetical protein
VNKPITNIAAHGDYITFDILDGGTKSDYMVFLPNYYGCTVATETGYTSPVAAGGEFKFTITLAPSHNQSTITVKSNGESLTPSGNVYTISNIQSDQIVTIEGLLFNTANITASASENGTITPSGTVAVPIGNSQRFDISPAIGYSIEDVLVDGTSEGAINQYIFRDVTAPHSINVTFKTGGIYTINTSIESAYFETPPGIPSEKLEVTVSSSDVVTAIILEAPSKFQISSNGDYWNQSFVLLQNQLPAKIYLRFNPLNPDFGPFNGTLTLKSISAYAKIALFGNVLVGIEEFEQTVMVYPNPTNGELRVTSYKLQVTGIELFDVYGRKLLSNHLIPTSSNHLINVSSLQAGVYIIAIHTDKGVIHKKIVKE